jgi:carbamoylphosphate synthase small subunit
MGVVRVWRHHDTDHPGLIGEAFMTRGFELQVELIDIENGPTSLEGVDILLVLGSSASVYDPAALEAWLANEMAVLGHAIEQEIPVFGICFGSQMLCQHFGGRVERAPEGEVGWFEVVPTTDTEISTGPWFEYHFDHCVLPDSATIVAANPRAVQAFTIGRNVGVQFHPEVDASQLSDWFLDDEAARNGTIDAAAHIADAAANHERLVRDADALVAWFLQRLQP